MKLALVIPQSGPSGIFGPSCAASAQLAVEEINDGGGILGRELAVVTVDGGRSPEAVAGDEGTFVHLMNEQAQRMGMKNTRFANPHGLPSPDNYSTARDLSILASHIIRDFPEFYKIDSVKEFTYNKIKQQNRNRLLWLDPTVDGMKTGHTEASGYSMIASAHRPNGPAGERRLISVLSGANSPQ